jgi:transposase
MARCQAGTRAKAVRPDHVADPDSEWAAISLVSGRLGMSAKTLRKWVRRAEIDAGEVPGVSTESTREIRDLKRKNAPPWRRPHCP